MSGLFDDVPEKAYRDPVVWLAAACCAIGAVTLVALKLAAVNEPIWYLLALWLVVVSPLAAAERNHRRHRRRDIAAAIRAARPGAAGARGPAQAESAGYHRRRRRR